jgi:hypothetical protein
MATQPTVMVLMPVLEAHQFVSDAIESVVAQPFETDVDEPQVVRSARSTPAPYA